MRSCARSTPEDGKSLENIRRGTRARIQHINDFLKAESSWLTGNPPHEHVIVFETAKAQRAWDEKQGLESSSGLRQSQLFFLN